MTADRRARFREYMRRLDPTTSPDRAMEEGFYVAAPSAVAARIGTRLDIDPTSAHLVVGGIGSGKTTELLAIRKQLLSVPDMGVAMVDVLTRQSMSKLEPGVLIVLAGLEVIDWVAREHGAQIDPTVFQHAAQTIRRIAHGRMEAVDEDDVGYTLDLTAGEQWVPGVVEEPIRSVDLEAVAHAARAVLQAVGSSFTLLFDGLDRVPDPQVFSRMVREDIHWMKEASVGVVVVGPQSLRFTADPSLQALFSEVHLHGAVNTQTTEGQAFLRGVLRKRVDAAILPDPVCERLVMWSGGVMRDLISLARAAGETAYSLGHDAVEVSDVEVAADRFGRGLVLGMTKDMLESLLQLTKRHHVRSMFLRNSEPGVIATDADVSLLLHRVLIEVPTTPVQYLVHPTVVPLLPHLLRKTA